MRRIALFILFIFLFWPLLGGASLEEEIDALQEKIEVKNSHLNELEEEIEIYEKNITQKQEESLNLENQLSAMDDEIAKHEKEIEKRQEEIEVLRLKIEEHELQIRDLESKIAKNNDDLGNLIRTYYENEQKTYLEILLIKNTLSEFSSELVYLTSLQDTLRQTLAERKKAKSDLETEKTDLETDKKSLEEENFKLQGQVAYLEGEKETKNDLLGETQMSEKEFQQLVEKVRAEKEQVDVQVAALEEKLKAKLKKQEEENPQAEPVIPAGFNPQWPLSGTITAYFHDPGYIFRRYFEHDAIDIAAPQGTEVQAVDDGYVAIAKWDGTTAYSYILIVHDEGYATLYGHMSSVSVEPEQYVSQGQVIGKSGGTPGTAGAGTFTTGPHLHFGVRLNGIPVDPLAYLS